jgi:hypothetical protein
MSWRVIMILHFIINKPSENNHKPIAYTAWKSNMFEIPDNVIDS